MTKKSIHVAVGVIYRNNQLFICKRPDNKHQGGLWEFPGGKIERGETPEAALIRELKEELSIDVTAACLAPLSFASHAYDAFHLLMPLYVCRKWEGQIMPREGQAVTWKKPRQLFDMEMPPADVPLIAALRDAI